MTERPFQPIRKLAQRTRRRQPLALEEPRPAPSTPDAKRRARASLVDSAVYVAGDRAESPTTLGDSYRALHAHDDAVGWIGLYKPSQHELGSLAEEFDLHALAVEDAILAHQRPKLERYGDTLFVVLRAARYVEDTEEVEFSELHVFVGPDFVITVRHGEAPDLGAVRRRMESNPDLLQLGPEAILYAVVDRVVDGYAPVIAGLANDIDEIETQVFQGDPGVSRRIYELNREVIEFQRAANPLIQVVRALAAGFEKYHTDEELQRYLRDVEDHLTQVVEQVDEFRHLLRDILTVNATLVAQQQNEEMKALSELSVQQNDEVKKISAWAAILFAPTLVGTIYGMNFDHMPELHWRYGYFFALGLMALANISLYIIFKRRNWI